MILFENQQDTCFNLLGKLQFAHRRLALFIVDFLWAFDKMQPAHMGWFLLLDCE